MRRIRWVVTKSFLKFLYGVGKTCVCKCKCENVQMYNAQYAYARFLSVCVCICAYWYVCEYVQSY